MPHRTTPAHAWILCLPACAALIAFNLAPAAQTLWQMGAAASSTAESQLFADLTASIGRCLVIEVPLALAIALTLVRRQAGRLGRAAGQAGLAVALPALAAGFLWRGAASDAPDLVRNLPMAIALFTIFLSTQRREALRAAEMEVSSLNRHALSLLLGLCQPVIIALLSLRVFDVVRAGSATPTTTWIVSAVAVVLVTQTLAPLRGVSE